MKTKHERFPPKIANYRDYKTFDTKTFKDRLDLTLKNTTSFEQLQKIFMDLLNKFTPLKCKYLRANHSKLITKELSKAIMLTTRFRHQFLKMKRPEAKVKYNKQRKICVSLTRIANRNYYESLNCENGVLIKDEKEVDNIFNNFFMNTVLNLGIKTQHEFLNNTDNS